MMHRVGAPLVLLGALLVHLVALGQGVRGGASSLVRVRGCESCGTRTRVARVVQAALNTHLGVMIMVVQATHMMFVAVAAAALVLVHRLRSGGARDDVPLAPSASHGPSQRAAFSEGRVQERAANSPPKGSPKARHVVRYSHRKPAAAPPLPLPPPPPPLALAPVDPPTTRPKPPLQDNPSAALRRRPSHADGGGQEEVIRVLCVDDEPVNQAVLRALLHDSLYDLVELVRRHVVALICTWGAAQPARRCMWYSHPCPRSAHLVRERRGAPRSCWRTSKAWRTARRPTWCCWT